ncbi:hypothetical protein C8D70_1257 [Chryseobacterium sp. CBTAP 102]|uniref:hypothetical protein n=1 Tax=Chryseobacterium sp. CBTAP 102 TaxID=2135644 RepID=UPI000D759C78|nr:hypothetical protein [Chryseobacterium sp. CBTAP 102]PXW06475.1 hypothetical protein C8D70_1257 [Chryseobacterium sp. CBTAP 102]
MAETKIKNLSSLDEEKLLEYKKQRGEKTNSKAFVMAIYDFFEQKEKIEALEKELQASKAREIKLKNKYQKYDIVFDGIKSIITNQE